MPRGLSALCLATAWSMDGSQAWRPNRSRRHSAHSPELQRRRHRVDDGFVGTGVDDDGPRTGPVLLRARTQKERAGGDDAVRVPDGIDVAGVGAVGYSLAFGTDVAGGVVGGADYLFLRNVLPSQAVDGSIVVPMEMTLPKSLHMVYQMMFFIITPALICGAYAERMKFSAMVLFSVAWGTLVYCPLAHWVWSATGWLNFLNANAACPSFDFAGGTVVHISSGASALVCSLMLGRRLGYGQEPMVPHNLTYTCVGAAMLWVGWFGFNAGSALGATGAGGQRVRGDAHGGGGRHGRLGRDGMDSTGQAEHPRRVFGAVAGFGLHHPRLRHGHPVVGHCAGGGRGCRLLPGMQPQGEVRLRRLSLDAFGVHGVGGIVGALLTGVFATRLVVPGAAGPQGLLEGRPLQLVNQGVGVLAAIALAVIGSVAILKLLDMLIGLRVSQQQELQGLDVSLHGEEGYIFL